jgi:predicted phage terminase large subunit-like protein
MERVRRNADQIRANSRRFEGFFREAWATLEPTTTLRWNWHLSAVAEHLEAISNGQLTRLIINEPPGSSKSLEVSVAWNAYEWGPLERPGMKFLSSSYELGNVTRDTRKTRNLILSDWYQELWPLKLIRAGETSFENQATGTREGVAFASLTAKRGDRLVIDDPHSLDGAESEAERTKSVRLFIEGGQNRLNDQTTSAIVIVMQRLHERDLTGELLARELGYEHLMIPMEFEPERRCVTGIGWKDPRTYDGELMDPQRFPRPAVDLLKKDNDYMWAGQYQQRPAPREGGMFKVEQITGEANELLVDFVPAGAKRVRGWDIAGSTRKKSPYTVGGKLAYKDGIVYIEHVARARAEIDKAERLIVDTAREDGITVRQSVPQDPGSAGKSQKFHLTNQLAGLDFMFSPETGEKADRAIPFASMVNAGSVRMVRGPWNGALIEEMRNFPASAFKDQVDALSRAFTELAKYMGNTERVIAGPMFGNEDALPHAIND